MGKFIRITLSKHSLLLFFLICCVWLSNTGCEEPPTPAEKVYLDTLRFKVAGDLKALNIDAQELVARKVEIREKWLPAIQDTFPDIKNKLNDDFQGMISTYDLYLNNHLLLISATQILEKEVAEFKTDTENGKYSRAEFKEKYREINTRVYDNSHAVEKIAKPVYDLEPMWIRLKLRFDRM